MDYDEIISGAFSWISLQKVAWFLIFFWLSFPVLVWVPQAIEKQMFETEMMALVYFLYDVMYVCAIIGFISLTQACLGEKRLSPQTLSLPKFIDTIFLVFVEAWFALVWNLNRRLRVPQLLLLIGIPLLYWYWLFDASLLPSLVLALFVWAYVSLVVYSCVRFCFSMMSFYHKDVSIVGAAKESWALTHNRFVEAISAIILSIGTAVVLFSITVIVLGAIANLVLLMFFTEPVAYGLAVRAATMFAFAPAILAYHYAVTNVYFQLVREGQSSATIRKILARKVLSKRGASHAHLVPKRSFAKKKAKKRRR